MIRIALVGASSQIAKDFIRSTAENKAYNLLLFVRDVNAMRAWLASAGLAHQYPVFPYSEYGEQQHDAVINFVGVGDPSRAAALGADILEITLEYDSLIVSELKKYPERRYIFISSGAVYGESFVEPVSVEARAVLPINSICAQNYYAVAKLHAEVRHRSLADLAVVDVRVFNYFSRYQSLASRFLIIDMINAIRSDSVLRTSGDLLVRDYLHPQDFYQLIGCILNAEPTNTVVDCYTAAPIEKHILLETMSAAFGLRYEVASGFNASINATGVKPNYYSKNRKAAEFGYVPIFSSLDALMMEVSALLAFNVGPK